MVDSALIALLILFLILSVETCNIIHHFQIFGYYCNTFRVYSQKVAILEFCNQKMLRSLLKRAQFIFPSVLKPL